jgi:hypothetical protein
MPRSEDQSWQHWIRSEQLPRCPRQELKASEADAFLEYLFCAVARRPKAISLGEGAGVARHLQALAWEAPPGKIQRFLDYLSQMVWKTVFQVAPIEMAGAEGTLEFLEKHRGTYLGTIDAVFGLEDVLQYIRDAKAVGPWPPPPNLLGPHLSAQGRGNPQLSDDLSERIYAGYHALRRIPIHGASTRIAKVLNGKGLRVRVRRSSISTWSPYEVSARVKQYAQRQRPPAAGREDVKKWRNGLVDCWILGYRQKEQWAKCSEDSTVGR